MDWVDWKHHGAKCVPARVQLESGNNQAGYITSVLSTPIKIKVTDDAGAPVPNIYVAMLTDCRELILRSQPFANSGNIWKEAEESTVIWPMQVGTSADASMSSFIEPCVPGAPDQGPRSVRRGQPQ